MGDRQERHDELRRPNGGSRALIQGNIGKAPYVNDKGTFASFNLATGFGRKNTLPGGGEEWENITTWWGVKVIGEYAVAKLLRQNLQPGDCVQAWVTEIELEEYTDKENYVSTKLTCRAESVESLVKRDPVDTGQQSSKPPANRRRSSTGGNATSSTNYQSPQAAANQDDDQDVPF